MSRPTWPQRLLGAFVVVQIVFLFAANLLPLLPHGRPDTGEVMDDITLPGRTFESAWLQGGLDFAGTATRRYGEATGQMQGWSLFAPLVASQSPFVLTELRWIDNDGRELKSEKISSQFEPANPKRFLTVPDGDVRLFNYEFRISHPLWFMTPEALAERPEQWQAWVPARVSRQQRSMRAYLRMQAAAYTKAHPDEPPPNELILAVRLYPISPPHSSSDFDPPPIERPLIRWRPLAGETVDYFDPIDARFIALGSPRSSIHE